MPGIDEIVDNVQPDNTDNGLGDMTGFSGDTISVAPESTGENVPTLTDDNDDVTEEQAETIVAATSSIYIVAAKLLKELHILTTDEFTQLIGECAKSDSETAA